MVELIVVMLLAAILSYSALGRLNDVGEVNAQGFADQLASSVRFAQRAAIAQRRTVYVNIATSGNRITACLDSATPCAQPLAQPEGGNLDIAGPADVALTTSNAQFSFNGAGSPSTSGTISIVASSPDGQAFTVTVQPTSGYVQRN
jgi:MSHA pilin protein MshC